MRKIKEGENSRKRVVSLISSYNVGEEGENMWNRLFGDENENETE